MTANDFVNEMKRLKKRVTPARMKIFKVIHFAKSPISADKLVQEVKVNKTTVYRDLDLFMKNGFIKDIDFGDGTKRYEVKDSDHHHHLICLQCKKIDDVLIEEKFEVPNNFRVVKHSLEFFGYCQNCI